MAVKYRNLLTVVRINTNVCIGMWAVVLKYSYHYTIKLALIILLSHFLHFMTSILYIQHIKQNSIYD